MCTYTRGQTIAVTAVAAFTALLIGIAVGKGSLDGIKEWQTVVGAMMALAAVIVALWNVRRQLRMTLIAREEALMEERHPGLQQAANFVQFFNMKLSIDNACEKLPTLLREYNIRGLRNEVEKGLDQYLPLTDATTRFLLLQTLTLLNSGLNLIEEGSGLAKSDDGEPADETDLQISVEMIAQGQSFIDRAKADLINIEAMLSLRLHNWNERLPHFRAEIEAYFDR